MDTICQVHSIISKCQCLNVFKTRKLFIFSLDTPSGTGDHENFFADTPNIYELNGAEYRECKKIAMKIRSTVEKKLWFALDYTIIFSIEGSSRTKYYYADIANKDDHSHMVPSGKSSYSRLPSSKFGWEQLSEHTALRFSTESFKKS